MFSFLNNIPPVTKNILILNVLFFLLLNYFESQHVDLNSILGAYYVNSPLFQPFQVVTHFFMHGSFMHILMNMWIFVMLGSFLEQLWGAKRFFIFYIASALGAFALYNIMGVYETYQLKQLLSSQIDMTAIDQLMKTSIDRKDLDDNLKEYLMSIPFERLDIEALYKYMNLCITPMVGASGAVFGILAAFAILFPNTEFLIYFTIPVKAKYLVGAYFVWEVYQSFNAGPGDNVAHLAHVGGAIVGAIFIFVWRKKDKKNFY